MTDLPPSRLLLPALVPHGGTWVELGVAAGHFAEQVCAARPDVRYIGIDRWSDHHDAQEMAGAVKRLQKFDHAQLCRLSFEEAARTMPEDSVDAVYVDGYAHTGQDRGRTLDLWWPKVKRGGFMCGHDYDLEKWPHTYKAVTYFAGHRGLKVEVIPEAGGYASWMIRRPRHDRVLVNGSIVLVGNGASMTGSGLGRVVENFDEVVRFNHYKLETFSADVGLKTTLWSCYGKNAETVRPDPCARVIYLHGAKAFPEWHAPEEIWRVPVAFYDQVKADLCAASKLPAERLEKLLPSAGLVTLRWLLDYHRVRQVHVCGFDHFSRATTAQCRHHYWLSGKFSEPQEHDGAAEAALFDDLSQSGRCVRLHPSSTPTPP